MIHSTCKRQRRPGDFFLIHLLTNASIAASSFWTLLNLLMIYNRTYFRLLHLDHFWKARSDHLLGPSCKHKHKLWIKLTKKHFIKGRVCSFQTRRGDITSGALHGACLSLCLSLIGVSTPHPRIPRGQTANAEFCSNILRKLSRDIWCQSLKQSAGRFC